jgi:hypothetical protein
MKIGLLAKLFCVVLLFSAPAVSDSMSKTVSTTFMGPKAVRTVLVSYFKDGRFRMVNFSDTGEQRGPVSIHQYDTRKIIWLDLARQEYAVSDMPSPEDGTPLARNVTGPGERVNVKIVDTGETRMFFGRKARRYVTTVTRTILGAGEWPEPGKDVVDAWYIELEKPFAGSGNGLPATSEGSSLWLGPWAGSSSQDRIEVVVSGPVPTGMEVLKTTTSERRSVFSGPSRISKTTNKIEVVEYSEEPLDPALFEPPPHFKKVDRLQPYR